LQEFSSAPPFNDGILMREVIMTMQTENKGHGLANNFAAQMALLGAMVIGLIVLSWYYVW
jgi:hypothetical protein